MSTSKAARRIVPGLPVATPGMRIGLLGGSFNPAHAGHQQISEIAYARLGLDRVWWLVSPGNPLKPDAEQHPLETRSASTNGLRLPPFVRVTTLEKDIATRYSIDTVRYLTDRFRTTKFVWLMGADNLVIFHRWKCWRELAGLMPIAVIDRPGAGLAATASNAARFLERHRLDEEDAMALATARPPAWLILHGPLSPLSSTAIRAGA